ncbi:hypothetical protein BSNK01_07240 [Bacillaceae bacterium]
MRKYDPDRVSDVAGRRNEKETQQPKTAKERAPGYGSKKLDGPNRPST